jgi:hypothetical protein
MNSHYYGVLLYLKSSIEVNSQVLVNICTREQKAGRSNFVVGHTTQHVGQCLSNCGSWTTGGLQQFARWSTAVCRLFSEEKALQKLSDTELMKNTPTHVCAKTACVG